MKKKNISGLITIASVLALFATALMISLQGEMVKATYVKTAMVLLTLVVASAGFYIVDAFLKDSVSGFKKITLGAGCFLVLFSFLVSFDFLPFLSTWNYLVAFGIAYVLWIQLQLLRWRQTIPQMVRFFILFIVICDLFLIFFFLTKWYSYLLAPWINFTVILSIVATAAGLAFLREKKAV